MIAALQAKESDAAFVKLVDAIGKVGEAFPKYTELVPFEPKEGEPLRFIVTGTTHKEVTEICPSQDWDSDLQRFVNRLPQITPKRGAKSTSDSMMPLPGVRLRLIP